ncbi:MAG: FHA domain-containing protein [Myxococcota bacterium]|nr:FHA domain-containing protein [Myxococcota bacterium]
MFAIVVEGLRRACFDQAVVEIGRSTLNDLVLPRPEVSRHHARITVEEDGFVVSDLGSGHGTWVDGVRIESRALVSGSRLTIGPFTLVLEANAAPYGDEQRLLSAITERNDANSRLVYADFLEQRGELSRAAFLRMQEALVDADPGTPAFQADSEKLRSLAAAIEMKWRYAVARPAVEGCKLRLNVRCPKEWGSLAPTERPDVRHCESCHKHVYYCANVAIARNHIENGDCVAIDVIPKREQGDLDPSAESGDMPMIGYIPMPD